MTPEAAGLIGAVIGATAGMAGGFIAQGMQARSGRLNRIANLGAQLAAASYIVAQSARRAHREAEPNTRLSTSYFLDVPAFQDGILASAELAIIAPDEVANRATSLANAMVQAAKKAGLSDVSDREWTDTLAQLKNDRNAFTKSMRESKLRLVAKAGATAMAAGAITGVVGRG